jgi:hypothetical protein
MSVGGSLESARAALKNLESYVSSRESVSKSKKGVIFLLSSPTSECMYVGCEYVGNLEKHLKELILRAEAYKEQGSIFHDSYEVMSQDEVRFELLEEVLVGNKYELGSKALEYIEKLGKVCNIWYPEDMYRSYNEKEWRLVSDSKKKELEKLEEYRRLKLEEGKMMYEDVKIGFNNNIKRIKCLLDSIYEERIRF